MVGSKTVTLLYGKTGITLSVPETARILKGPDAKPLENPHRKILEALNHPIGTVSLKDLLQFLGLEH